MPYRGRIETGHTGTARARRGWITARFVTAGRRTGAFTPTSSCGRSVGRCANPGERVDHPTSARAITSYCSGPDTMVPATVFVHELGHAMGFWHVADGSVMDESRACGIGGATFNRARAVSRAASPTRLAGAMSIVGGRSGGRVPRRRRGSARSPRPHVPRSLSSTSGRRSPCSTRPAKSHAGAPPT